MHTLSANKTTAVFDRITQWNEDGGNPRMPLGQADLEAFRKQFKYVAEEFGEANVEAEALRIDVVKAAKELGDLVFTAVEALRRLGVDPHVILNLVCDSNDSKYCCDQGEVVQAQNHFAVMGLKVEQVATESGFIVFKSAENQTLDGKFYPQGKILKAPCFFKAESAIKEYADSLNADGKGA